MDIKNWEKEFDKKFSNIYPYSVNDIAKMCRQFIASLLTSQRKQDKKDWKRGYNQGVKDTHKKLKNNEHF